AALQRLAKNVSKIRGVNECSPVFNFSIETHDSGLPKCRNVLGTTKVPYDTFREFFGKYGGCLGSKISKVRCRSLAQPGVLQHRVASCDFSRRIRRTTPISVDFFNHAPDCADR